MVDQKDPIDILIIGFGALGTIYGYILSQNPQVRVTGLARSTAASYTTNGCTIESEKFGVIPNWRPYRVVGTPEEAADRPYHYVIGTFKCVPDLLPSAAVLAPFLESEHTKKLIPTVVLIQNGIGIEHPVQQSYPHIPIISAVAWIGANLHPGPRVTHGFLEELVFGLYQGEGRGTSVGLEGFTDPAGYLQEGGEERRLVGVANTVLFETLLRNGGGKATRVEDIQPKRYEKVIWNAAWSAACTLSRSTVSAMVAPAVLPYTLPVVRRLGLEVLYVAREWGYSEEDLPLKTVDNAIKLTIRNYQVRTEPQTPFTPLPKGDGFGSVGYGFPAEGGSEGTAGFKPSMLLDVENGRPSELEPIIGSLLDRARAKGLETPRLDLVYATLKVNQAEAIKKHASSPEHQAHIQNWLLRRPAVAGAGLDGRKEWEKAVRRAEQAKTEGTGGIEVSMANGKQKVTGKPIPLDDDAN
ncbi:6-phosphogluconate dehydrogenase C-terminal domain-like protein [Meredithblackwellia eburnea MCA 4105]